MTAWYRNEDWSSEIAADFERRLARSRHQKAQNLALQGYHLIPRHPVVARDLLERAIALGDEHQTPRALGFLALAHLALGDVDEALDTYERALLRQTERPNVIAVQPADYLFLVGVFEHAERLRVALPMTEALADDGPFGPDAQALAAKALVLDLAGRTDEACRYAKAARPMLESLPYVAAMGIAIGDVRRRLEAMIKR